MPLKWCLAGIDTAETLQVLIVLVLSAEKIHFNTDF